MDFRRYLLRTPLYPRPPWNYRTGYWIVDWFTWFMWLLRIASPAAWILSRFQVEGRAGRLYVKPEAAELYVLITHGCVLLVLVLAPSSWLSHCVSLVIAILLIVEICQFNLYAMILRPVLDRNYIQYNFARTMLLILISYQSLISLFAIVFFSGFPDQFNVRLNTVGRAWSLSAGILAGTGFSGITPTPGSTAAVIGGIESVIGILFLTAILGLALSRISSKAIDVAVSRDSHAIVPYEVRRALIDSGKGKAIDEMQKALQVDLWITGGWLRSHALGVARYDGDVDLLISDLSHDELAERLKGKGINFTRGRLGGFSFSPMPGVKIDCFSTRSFGPGISIQESFRFFNATVNAAAFKFSSPDTFFSHALFEHDATKRLLRILPDGLREQPERERAQSLSATLRLLMQDGLGLVIDNSTRDLIHSLAKDSDFAKECLVICRWLDRAQRHHEAEIIRRWLD